MSTICITDSSFYLFKYLPILLAVGASGVAIWKRYFSDDKENAIEPAIYIILLGMTVMFASVLVKNFMDDAKNLSSLWNYNLNKPMTVLWYLSTLFMIILPVSYYGPSFRARVEKA